MMKNATIRLAAAVLSACIGGCATKEAGGPESWTTTRTGDRKVERAGLVTATATVQAIDVEKRLITLKGPDGESMTIVADEAVRNLPQIKKGDQVLATYYESLVVEAKEPGQAVPGASTAGGVELAPLGEKPAATTAGVVKVTAKVLRIDLAKGTITLEGAQGQPVTVKAREPKNLEKVKVGDLLEITYTRALALSVEKAP